VDVVDVVKDELPRSVAIIMDGNGRWAERRGISRKMGHWQGAKTAEDIIRYAHELGIKYLTLYAFSSENWQRPVEEIRAVMEILENYLNNDPSELVKNGIRIIPIGEIERLPQSLARTLENVTQKTAECSKLVITLALSYGAWGEIARACKAIARKVAHKELELDAITEDVISNYLYTKNTPHPDLFIRTSGELRLSNFLLFQLSYSELYFTPTLWPDFQRADFDLALSSYASRQRRFGATKSLS
jgi:undecaprenyl diphosphate synthase